MLPDTVVNVADPDDAPTECDELGKCTNCLQKFQLVENSDLLQESGQTSWNRLYPGANKSHASV